MHGHAGVSLVACVSLVAEVSLVAAWTGAQVKEPKKNIARNNILIFLAIIFSLSCKLVVFFPGIASAPLSMTVDGV